MSCLCCPGQGRPAPMPVKPASACRYLALVSASWSWADWVFLPESPPEEGCRKTCASSSGGNWPLWAPCGCRPLPRRGGRGHAPHVRELWPAEALCSECFACLWL